jgi:dolichol-phosphate mannosyltransferase
MTRKQNKRVLQLLAVKPLVVLPTFNEAENIVEVLDLVRAAAPEADVLVVDDGSPDGTAELAEGWGEHHGGVSVLRRAGKQGLGSAYRAGFAHGLEQGYGILIEMDSDLQHDPAMLPALIHAVQDGADLAIGSRYVPGGAVPGWKLSRRIISQGGNIYAATVLGMKVRDATAGFRAYSSDALRRIELSGIKADGYGFQIEMAYTVSNNGGRIVEVPITFADRVRGTSKMSTRIVVEALLLVTWWGFRDRVARPLRRALRRRSAINR